MYVRKQFRRRRFSVKTHFSHTSLVSVWIQQSGKVENHAFFKFSVKVDTNFSWNRFSCKKDEEKVMILINFVIDHNSLVFD